MSANEQSSPSMQPESTGGEPIAIVGMACRFPGANDLESF